MDHDLLIKISVQLENLSNEFKSYKSEQESRINSFETSQAKVNEGFGTRIRTLEDWKIWLVGYAAAAGSAAAFLMTRFLK